MPCRAAGTVTMGKSEKQIICQKERIISMKLSIGENIRSYRKKNDLTQEQLAERLGVTYQSVSRWENGTTYPDLELLPAISNELSVTVDELLGMPQAEKEKRAEEAFDELRRECMKKEYDAERIVALIRDIRLNYMGSGFAWRPWCEGNDRAFRDPVVLPEVRLMAEAYLARYPMYPHAIQTMAYIEDEEHLEAFLEKYTTPFDCSARALLFERYWRRMDGEKFEQERRYQFWNALDILLSSRYLHKWRADDETRRAADEWMEALLALVRRDAADDAPDAWVDNRIDLGLKRAGWLVSDGKNGEALAEIEAAVSLLEKTMEITDEGKLPVSCRFLDGMERTAKETWSRRNNNPDRPEERAVFMVTRMNGMSSCSSIFPSVYANMLGAESFAPLRGNTVFEALCERVKVLIVTR